MPMIAEFKTARPKNAPIAFLTPSPDFLLSYTLPPISPT
jgi:hypothetical protein